MLGAQDRNGILLLYHPPYGPAKLLPKLVELASGLGSETPRLVVLGTSTFRTSWSPWYTMVLSQSPGHTLDLVFSEQEKGDQKVSGG